MEYIVHNKPFIILFLFPYTFLMPHNCSELSFLAFQVTSLPAPEGKSLAFLSLPLLPSRGLCVRPFLQSCRTIQSDLAKANTLPHTLRGWERGKDQQRENTRHVLFLFCHMCKEFRGTWHIVQAPQRAATTVLLLYHITEWNQNYISFLYKYIFCSQTYWTVLTVHHATLK